MIVRQQSSNYADFSSTIDSTSDSVVSEILSVKHVCLDMWNRDENKSLTEWQK